jgi:hypothetical protein
MVLGRLVAENLSLEVAEQVPSVRYLRANRLRRSVEHRFGRGPDRKRSREIQELCRLRAHAGAHPLRDRGGEGGVHRGRGYGRTRQAADSHHHLAELLYPLAAGLAAAEVVPRPLKVLAVKAIVENGTRRDPSAALRT